MDIIGSIDKIGVHKIKYYLNAKLTEFDDCTVIS